MIQLTCIAVCCLVCVSEQSMKMNAIQRQQSRTWSKASRPAGRPASPPPVSRHRVFHFIIHYTSYIHYVLSNKVKQSRSQWPFTFFLWVLLPLSSIISRGQLFCLTKWKLFFFLLLPLSSIISEGQLFCLTRRKLFMLQVIPSTVAEVVQCDQMKHLISLNVIANPSNAAQS